jgi:hypothetical protein
VQNDAMAVLDHAPRGQLAEAVRRSGDENAGHSLPHSAKVLQGVQMLLRPHEVTSAPGAVEAAIGQE